MFLETICIENGIAQNMATHVERMRKTALRFGFTAPKLPSLLALLPQELRGKKVKCSITYHEKISDVLFSEYVPKKINSLKLIETDLDYAFKFSDRAALNALLKEKGNFDEILVVKNGCITDTTYNNVVFRKANNFFTPDTYLLNGTKRQKLLWEGKISETRITFNNLHQFDELFLINAMLNVEDKIGVKIKKIET